MEEIGNIIIKWSGKEYTITGLQNTTTVLQLKKLIHDETGVLPERQKLLGLKYSGKLATEERSHWITAKRTGTKGQQGHTRPRPNPYSDPKLNPIAKS